VKEALRDFLGGDYRVEALKSVGLRARNLLKPWLIRQPRRSMACVVHGPDGRRYKLLPRLRPEQLQSLAETLRLLAPLDAVPNLLWADSRDLLVEWVDGSPPDLAAPSFPVRLGEVFAALHRIGRREAPVDELLEAARADAERLRRGGHLSAALADAIPARLAGELPDRIPQAMLYRDQTRANFLVDDRGDIHLIDLGSFQADLPVDLFLAGSEVYEAIDQAAFREAYAAAGGGDFPFRHGSALKLVHALRVCAREAHILSTLFAFERARRQRLERGFATRLERLRGAVEARG